MRSRGRHSPARGARAFTLLEVMVAVAILGLGLTVILTAQTGLFSSSKRAAQLSEAVGLARCKMSEIEEDLLRKGYQLTKDEEEGACCDDEESALRCRWSVIPVTLPDLSTAGFERDAGAGESESTGDPTAAMDKFGEAEESLSGGDTAAAMEQLGGSSASGLASMAIGLVYPQLKGMLEASIRKVTVQVYWKEGSTERDLSITQYVTNPQQGGMLAEGEGGAGNLPTP
ncbi:MAG TPA: type II secretion system protein [Polyangiaceae bacterium]|nr:type II secretion system protein [Polyangiaceae bacterium]